MTITIEELEKRIQKTMEKQERLKEAIDRDNKTLLGSIVIYLFGMLCGSFITWLILTVR